MDTVEAIKNLTRKNPTVQKVFLNMHNNFPSTDWDIIKDTYEEFKKYQNLLKNNEFNIKKFKEEPFEALFDEISSQAFRNEKKKYALSFISKKYDHLLNEESYELFYSIKEMNLSHQKVNDLVVKKIARYKTPEEFNDSMRSFIDGSRNHEISSIIQKMKDSDVNAKIIKEDHDKNLLILEIQDYEASNTLGSKSWCISTRKSYFKNYIQEGHNILDNKQYFMWDFNKLPENKESMIGFTLKMDKTIAAAHYKNDGSLSSKNLKSIFEKYNIEIPDIYSEEEIVSALKKSKARPVEKLKLMFNNLEDKEVMSDIFHHVVFSKGINSADWSNIYRSKIKSPESFFKLLEEQYEKIKEKSLSRGVYYNNFKLAIESVLNASTHKGYRQEPIYLKYYWQKENIEKLLSEKWMRPYNESSKIFTNVFNIDMLNFYKKFKNEESDYITSAERIETVKHIIKRYQHSVGEKSLQKFLEWDGSVLNDRDIILSIAYANAENVEKINSIAKLANWKDEEFEFIFSKNAVIGKVLKNKDQLEYLSDVQRQVIKDNMDINVKDFSEVKLFEGFGLMKTEILENSFQSIIKPLCSEDVNEMTSFFNTIKEYDAEVSVNRKILELALKEKDGYKKCSILLDNSSDPKNICDFMLESRNLIKTEEGRDKVFEVVSENIKTEETALTVLDKVNLKTYQPITQTFIPVILEHLDVNKAFAENDSVKKILVKVVNKGDAESIAGLMSKMTPENQESLIMMSEKGKDPLVKFLMNKLSEESESLAKNNSKSKVKLSM